MKIQILGSSSAGNCTIIDDHIMIDFGLQKDLLIPYLKNGITTLICTHNHGDHYNSAVINWLKANKPAVYKYGLILNSQCASLAGVEQTKKRHFFDIRTIDDEYEIYLFPVLHDVECQGMTIFKKSTNELLIYATDLAKLPELDDINTVLNHYQRSTFDYILMEGNYDKQTLVEALQDLELEDRAVRNLRHLSNDKLLAFVEQYSNDNTQSYQMHMSEMFGKQVLDRLQQ